MKPIAAAFLMSFLFCGLSMADNFEATRKNAEHVNAVAQRKVAFSYEMHKDLAKAANWYREAAENGDAIAQVNLGQMYLNGRGVPMDYAEGLKWVRKAADRGNVNNAQYMLGEIYRDGVDRVTQNYAEAANWFYKAADNGDVSA